MITHVETEAAKFALTFDDGPSPEWTPQVLRLLARHRARATFFVVGAMVERHPEIVSQAVAEGHAIGRHSWNHASLPSISRPERRRQLDWQHPCLPESTLFRPPFGDLDWSSRLALLRRGSRVVAWNVSGSDWEPRSAAVLVETLRRQVQPGSIVLLHDQLFTRGPGDLADRRPMLEAVDRFLEVSPLQSVTIPELLAAGKPVRRLWRKSSDPAWLRSLTSEGALGFPH